MENGRRYVTIFDGRIYPGGTVGGRKRTYIHIYIGINNIITVIVLRAITSHTRIRRRDAPQRRRRII